MIQNPAAGIAKVLLPNRRTGFLQWTEEDLERYEGHWPIGTRERLALDLLVFTGVRRSDAVRLGNQHMHQNGEIVIRTEKSVNSGNPVEVTIPILPLLALSIAATATGKLTFLITTKGAPFAKESFGNWFKKACKAGGIDDAARPRTGSGGSRRAVLRRPGRRRPNSTRYRLDRRIRRGGALRAQSQPGKTGAVGNRKSPRCSPNRSPNRR